MFGICFTVYCLQAGWTALHYATSYGRLSVVKYLIKMGADVDLPTIVSACYY